MTEVIADRRQPIKLVASTLVLALALSLLPVLPAQADQHDPRVEPLAEGLASLGRVIDRAGELGPLGETIPLTVASPGSVAGLDGGVVGAIFDQGQEGGSVEAFLGSLEAATAPSDDTEVTVGIAEVEGADDENADLTFDLTFDITRTVDVPLFYDDPVDEDQDPEFDGGAPSLWFGQGRVADVVATTSATLPVGLRVGESQAGETTYTFELRDPADAGFSVDVGIGPAGGITEEFTARYGLLEADPSATGEVLDLSIDVELVDPDSSGTGTIERRELVETHPADLLVIAFDGGSTIELGLELTQEDLFVGSGFDAADELITVETRGSVEGAFPEDRDGYYPSAVLEIGARFAPFDDMTVEDVLVGLGEMALAIRAGAAAGDVDLPLLADSLAEVVDPGGPLVDFVRERSEALIACGSTDTSPPEGIARDGQTAYCQAFANVEVVPGSVEWTLHGDPDHADLDVPADQDTTVGIAPEANVSVATEDIGGLRVDWEIDGDGGDEGPHRTAVPRFDSLQGLARELEAAGFGTGSWQDLIALTAVAGIDGVGEATTERPVDVVTLDLATPVEDTVDVEWQVDDAFRQGARLSLVRGVDVGPAQVGVVADVSATGGLVMDPDLPRPGADAEEPRDGETVERIRGRFLLSDGGDDLVDVTTVAVAYDSEGADEWRGTIGYLPVEVDFDYGLQAGNSTALTVAIDPDTEIGDAPANGDYDVPDTGSGWVRVADLIGYIDPLAEEEETAAIAPTRGFDATVDLEAEAEVDVADQVGSQAAFADDLGLSGSFTATWSGQATSEAPDDEPLWAKVDRGFAFSDDSAYVTAIRPFDIAPEVRGVATGADARVLTSVVDFVDALGANTGEHIDATLVNVTNGASCRGFTVTGTNTLTCDEPLDERAPSELEPGEELADWGVGDEFTITGDLMALRRVATEALRSGAGVLASSENDALYAAVPGLDLRPVDLLPLVELFDALEEFAELVESEQGGTQFDEPGVADSDISSDEARAPSLAHLLDVLDDELGASLALDGETGTRTVTVDADVDDFTRPFAADGQSANVPHLVLEVEVADTGRSTTAPLRVRTVEQGSVVEAVDEPAEGSVDVDWSATTTVSVGVPLADGHDPADVAIVHDTAVNLELAAGEGDIETTVTVGGQSLDAGAIDAIAAGEIGDYTDDDAPEDPTTVLYDPDGAFEERGVVAGEQLRVYDDEGDEYATCEVDEVGDDTVTCDAPLENGAALVFAEDESYDIVDADDAEIRSGTVGDSGDSTTQLTDPDADFLDEDADEGIVPVAAGHTVRILDEDGEPVATCEVAEDGVTETTVTCADDLAALVGPSFGDEDAATYQIDVPGAGTFGLDVTIDLAHPDQPGASRPVDFAAEVVGTVTAAGSPTECEGDAAVCLALSLVPEDNEDDALLHALGVLRFEMTPDSDGDLRGDAVGSGSDARFESAPAAVLPQAAIDGLDLRPLDFVQTTTAARYLEQMLGDAFDGSLTQTIVPLIGDNLDAGAGVDEVFGALYTAIDDIGDDLEDAVEDDWDPAEQDLDEFITQVLAGDGADQAGALASRLDGFSVDVAGQTVTPDIAFTVDVVCDAAPGDDCDAVGLVSDIRIEFDVSVGDFAEGDQDRIGCSDDAGASCEEGALVPFVAGTAGLPVAPPRDGYNRDAVQADYRWQTEFAMGISKGAGPYLAPIDGEDEAELDLGAFAQIAGAGDCALDGSARDYADDIGFGVDADRCADALIGVLPGLVFDGDGDDDQTARSVAETGVTVTLADRVLDFGDLLDRRRAAVDVASRARINLFFQTNAGQLYDDVAGGEGDGAMPTLLGTFHAFTSNIDEDLGGDFTGELYLYQALALDAGSFVTDVLGPVAMTIKGFTDPFAPILDVVTTPIPVISDISELTGGDEVTMLSLLNTVTSNDLTLLIRLVEAVQTANAVATTLVDLTDGVVSLAPGGEMAAFSSQTGSTAGYGLDVDWSSLPASDTEVFQGGGFTFEFDDNGDEPEEDSLWYESLKPTTKVSDKKPEKKEADKTIQEKVKDQAKNPEVKPKLEWTGPALNFPILEDPDEIFGMLLGRDATLVRFDGGTLKASVSVSWTFGPFAAGPVLFDIGIGGSLTLEGRFALGFDTYGFSRAMRGEPSFISPFADGLYLDDLDASGNDVDEIKLVAKISLTAAISVKIIRAGLEGEVIFTISFDLNDRRGDGKIRIEDIHSFRHDPICLFIVRGTLGFALNVFLEINVIIKKIKFSFTIWELDPPIELFEVACDPPEPVFGRVVDGGIPGNPGSAAWLPDRDDGQDWDGAFRLHVGGDASQRGIFTDETSEQFIVRQRSAYEGVPVDGSVVGEVYDLPSGVDPPTRGDLLEDLASIGVENTDEVPADARWVTLVEVEGFGENLVYAVPERHVIHAHTGEDNDTILLEPGRELEIPDPVERPDNGDPVDPDEPEEFDFLIPAWLQASPGDADDRNRFGGGDGGNVLIGSRGNDTLQGGREPDLIFGRAGNNSIEGSRGDNVLIGGPGNDQLSGGPGSDVIVGGPGANRIEGGPGLRPGTEPQGRTELTDTGNILVGGSGANSVTGGPSTDYVLAGGWPTDVVADHGAPAGLEGLLRFAVDPASDPSLDAAFVDTAVDAREWALGVLGGGTSLDRDLAADLCRAAEGIPGPTTPPSGNTVKAHRGDDLVVGGWGNDDLDAGRGDDIACVPDGDNVLQAGRGNNELHGGAGDDRLLGGPGNDWLTGGGGENYLRGRDGRNLLIGGVGSDVLEGGNSGELHVADGGPPSGAAGLYLRDGVSGFTRVTVDDADDPLDIGDWAVDSTGVGPSDGPPNGDGLNPFDVTVSDLYAEGEDGEFDFEPGALTACERSTRILADGQIDIEGDGVETERGRIDGFPVVEGKVVAEVGGQVVDFDGVIADADVRAGLVYLAGAAETEAGRLRVPAIGYDDDVLSGNEDQRANCALGGDGRDAIFGGPAADWIDAGFGDDFVDAGPGQNRARGGPGDTVLFGGPQANEIFGDSGDDAIFGGPDDDRLDGGPGDDYIEGNQGDDHLRGGAGDDILIGGSSGTAMGVYDDASPGDTQPREWWDTDLSSPSGDDEIFGNPGNDLLIGDNAWIASDGHLHFWEPGEEDAWLEEATSASPVFGGDDLLDGGEGENVLIGGLGDDELRAGNNASYLFGDLAWFWPTSGLSSAWAGGQPAWHGVLFDGEPFDPVDEADVPAWRDLVAQGSPTSPYALEPSDPDGATHWPGGAARYDALLAAPNVGGADHLVGSPEDDHLFGGAGDDVLEGGEGDDYLEGGPGDDRLYGSSEAFAIGDEEAGATSQPATLSGVVGQLFGERGGSLSTVSAAILPGNDLIGGSSSVHPDAADPDGPGAPSGRNIVVGADGADVAYGDNVELDRLTVAAAPGDAGEWALDATTGGRAREVVPYDLHRVADGYEIDLDAAGSEALGTTEDDTLDGAGALDGERTLGGDDVIVGINGPNRLYGGPGDDYIRGGPGDDYAEGGPGDDWLEGGGGDDDLIGGGSFAATGSRALDTGEVELGTEGFPSGANVVLGQDGQNVLAGDNARVLRTDPDTAGAGDFDTYLATEGRFVGFDRPRWVSLLDLDGPLEGSIAGDDLLSAGPGNSLLFGQGGDDWVSGGGGDDYAEGGGGDDVLLGDRPFGITPEGGDEDAASIAVDDLLAERPTIDRRGHDLASFRWPAQQRADDRYRNAHSGVAGATTVAHLEGDEGQAGQDDLIGGNSRTGLPAGDNTIYGDGNDDVLLGDNAAVVREVDGGEYARYDERYDPDYDGERTIVRDVVEHDVGASLDDGWFDADGDRRAAAPFGDDFLDGGPGDDMLHGQDGDDELWGSPVDDVAGVDDDGEPIVHPRGESWGDHLIGGLGDDELYGGPGHDVLVGDRGRVITRYLDDDSEAVIYDRNGPPFLSFTGLEEGDLWHRVDLYCKEDRSGDTPVFFGDGACSDGGAGDLTDDAADLEVLRYSHYEHGGDDVLRGGVGDSVLFGGGGNDVLQGDIGADALFGGRGDNVLLGGEGEAGVDSTDPADYARDDQREHVDMIFGGRGESLLDYRPRVEPGTDLDAGWTDPDVRLDADLWFRASRPYWHPDNVDDVEYEALRANADLSSLLDDDGTVADDGPEPMVARPQHHQGVAWQYGGWGRKVLQGSVTSTGPNDGDRMMDWSGAFNLYTHCSQDYGGHNILRAHSPAQEEAIHTMALIAGAGGSLDELHTPGTSGFDQIAFVSRQIPGSVQANAGAAYFDDRLDWGANLPGTDGPPGTGGTPASTYDQNIACDPGGVADDD